MTVTDSGVVIGTETGDVEISFELLKMMNGAVAKYTRNKRMNK
jgi:hypothetical protein